MMQNKVIVSILIIISVTGFIFFGIRILKDKNGGAAVCKFGFKLVAQEDLPLLYKWFKLPHVEKWWPTPEKKEDFFDSFLKRIRPGIKTAYLVLCNNVPIGYIQSYNVDRVTSTWLPTLPGSGKVIGIDQFIGEPAYLHKGLGTIFIKEFIKKLTAQEKNIIVMVDPEPANAAAIKCYEKVGFSKLGVYEAPWGPALIMIYRKD